MKQTFREIDDVFQKQIRKFDGSEEMTKFLEKIKITASKPEKDLYKFEGNIDLGDEKKSK